MRELLRWVIVGCAGLWLLAGAGALREGLSAEELLHDAPFLRWAVRLALVAWVWLVIGTWTRWRGRWAWPETLAVTMMLLYPTGWTALIFIVPVVAWGVFRWTRQRATA